MPAAVRALADDLWRVYLERHPVEATVLGHREHDGALPDPSPAGLEAYGRRLEGLRRRAEALDPAALAPEDQVTRRALLSVVAGEEALAAADLDAWTLDPLAGPQVTLLKLPAWQPVESVAQGRALVERYRAMGPYLDAVAASLRRSQAVGRVAPRSAAERVRRQLDALLADGAAALLEPAGVPHAPWPVAQREGYRADLRDAVERVVLPGFRALAEIVSGEILPAARGDDRPGLGHVPGGEAAYPRLARAHTGLDLEPQAVHALGLEEVAALDAEIEELGRRVLGVSGREEVLERLRSDPALFFASREEVESSAAAALDRALEALPRLVGRSPATPCRVRRVEAHEERDSTVAYYLEPAADGSRPGTYYINTFAPRTRPRYEAEALAFHESVPGHHVQIALAQERGDLPAFRRHLGSTAFVEGWALYTERLADEAGLYSSDLDRVGMLSFDAWRACRLVVDTGLHALGWSRERAVEFLRSHTALAEGNIQNEVDRYIVWPGQALAYKLGQRAIQGLRGRASRELGERFDRRAFHDRVLENGAVPLAVLEHEIVRWLDESREGP